MALRQPLADIQFISDFAAFCRTKGDEEYCPYLADACALAQFGRRGVLFPEREGIPSPAFKAVFEGGKDLVRFSALALRLEALLVDAPTVERG